MRDVPIQKIRKLGVPLAELRCTVNVPEPGPTIVRSLSISRRLLVSEIVQTLPLGLVRFASTYSSEYRLVFSGTVITFLPIILLYILTQRRFTEGLTQGALKG